MAKIFRIATLIGLIFMLTPLADSANDAAAADLEIAVDGVSVSRGNVRLALFSEADAALFPDRFPPLKRSMAATSPAVVFLFNHLAAGRYAALVFLDENSNDMLDRNIFGIPKERWGVSGQRPFGRDPRYVESTFLLDSEHHKITIHLE